MPTRTYLSIGEVLIQVKTEFPDITISKIRFLEAEGLINPERTPSGYRKFYDNDVSRLKSILRMQRDEYLPLKVIRDRLREEEQERSALTNGAAVAAPAPRTATAVVEEVPSEPPIGLQMSIEEMSAATGIEMERIRELRSYGLVCEHGPEGARYYDGEDFLVLSAVREFFRHGLEPRHLTLYRNFVDREASLLESIVLPQVRKRNPDAQRAATTALGELAGASRKLSAALLRRRLQSYLG